MSTTRQPPLRKIAENELVKHLGIQDATIRDELATSLVRQWITNDGHAGVIAPNQVFWFRMITHPEGGFEAGFETQPGNTGRLLTQTWHVAEEELPGLLHQLNVCQSVICQTGDGRTMRIQIDPKKREVRCETVDEEEATNP